MDLLNKKKSPMSWLKITLFFILSLIFSSALAQNKLIDKANKRYQAKKYAEAIPFYEEGLAQKSNLSSKAKLAYCYRMNNDIGKSLALYSEIVQEKRARPITMYYYGETLMSHGDYDEARVWLKKYTEKKTDDPKGWALLESIDNIQTIQPYYWLENVEKFVHNSDEDDSSPIFYNNGIVFSSDRKSGKKLMKKKSGWTGRDFLTLYYSKPQPDGSYGTPKSFSRKLNDMNKNTGTIAISPDGRLAVFSRNSDVANKRNMYNIMLYGAEITEGGKFKNIEMLPFCSNTVNYMHPTFSPDGQTIYFTSNKKGEGGTDIFYSQLGHKGWEHPINIGASINTESNEGFPFMDDEGRLYFCSKGHLSYGGFDIFLTEQDDKGDWTTPINLGMPINSSSDDISIFIEKGGEKGMFASSREGGDDDIYIFDIIGLNKNNSIDELDFQPIVQEETIQPVSEESSILEIEEKEIVNDSNTKKVTEVEVEDKYIVEEEIPFADTDEIEKPMEAEVKLDAKTISIEEVQMEIKIPTTEIKVIDKAPIVETAIEEEVVEMPTITPEESQFQEGLASTSNTMSDDLSIAETEIVTEADMSYKGLEKLKEYLTINNSSEGDTFVLESLKFHPNEYIVNASMVSYLEELVTLMIGNPNLKIEISGHTESIGNDKGNMIFSIKRATAIAGYLIRNGIQTDRVKVMGYGETQLLNHCKNGVTCTTEEHAINQRIEVKVLSK